VGSDPATDHAIWLEQIRRSGIRVDREGRFIHEGAEVTHEGLRRALFRWLDREPDGRHVLRLDARRFAYLDVDDTPLVARAARIDPAAGAVYLALSDGSEAWLDPATLTVDGAGVLADLISEEDGCPVLHLGGRTHPIPTRPPAGG